MSIILMWKNVRALEEFWRCITFRNYASYQTCSMLRNSLQKTPKNTTAL
jgi:hypothetical protein